jgi:hypothetical protein
MVAAIAAPFSGEWWTARCHPRRGPLSLLSGGWPVLTRLHLSLGTFDVSPVPGWESSDIKKPRVTIHAAAAVNR